MTPDFRKTALAFIALAVWAAPAYAKTTILPATPKTASVVIKQDNQTVIINTTPEAAEHIRKMVKNSDRVIVRLPSREGYTYYPENYYPYFRYEGLPYSTGYAAGRKISD